MPTRLRSPRFVGASRGYLWALKLTAARVHALGVEEVALRLEDCLRLLGYG